MKAARGGEVKRVKQRGELSDNENMRSLLVFASLLLPASALAGEGFGYVRATSQLAKDAPANLFDGRLSSVWCEGAKGDGVGERLVIGFKAPVTVDEVRIANGDTRGREQFAAHNRVERLELRDGTSRHVLSLADKGQEQAIKLEPALEADRLEIEILSVYPGTEGESTCLSTLSLLSGCRPLISEQEAAGPLKSGVATLMGRWYAGPRNARDRFLDFYADGTFQYLHRPFDPEEPARELSGEFAYDGKSSLRVRSGGKEWTTLEVKRTADVAPDGTARTLLSVGGASLEEELAGQWADVP